MSSVNLNILENGSLQSYKDFITTLSSEDEPQVFGQHPNANMISFIRQNRLLCKTLTTLQKQFNGTSDCDDKEKKVLIKLHEIIQNTPMLIDYKNVLKNIGLINPMDHILLQEVFFTYTLLQKTRMIKDLKLVYGIVCSKLRNYML